MPAQIRLSECSSGHLGSRNRPNHRGKHTGKQEHGRGEAKGKQGRGLDRIPPVRPTSPIRYRAWTGRVCRRSFRKCLVTMQLSTREKRTTLVPEAMACSLTRDISLCLNDGVSSCACELNRSVKRPGANVFQGRRRLRAQSNPSDACSTQNDSMTTVCKRCLLQLSARRNNQEHHRYIDLKALMKVA